MEKVDKDGNVVYRKIEMWYEYDDRGNCVYQKNSNGFEAWWEFDKQDRKIGYRNSEGIAQKWNMPEVEDLSPEPVWVNLEDIYGSLGAVK